MSAKRSPIAGEPARRVVAHLDITASAFTDHWICGVGYAIAEISRSHDESHIVIDVARAASLGLNDFKRAGLDEFDLSELRKCKVPKTWTLSR